MRLGIFGGTFDPVHYGHLLLAETCREQCRLDSVWFVPAATPPHKSAHPPAPAQHRWEMLRLAIGGHEALELSPLELDRGGVSYTFETLEAVHRQRPTDEIFLLVGADTLADMPNWREPQAILRLAHPVVVARAGAPAPDFTPLAALAAPEELAAMRRHVVAMPAVDLSSSDIRRRVAQGQSIRYRTPRAVEEYIRSSGLYRAAT